MLKHSVSRLPTGYGRSTRKFRNLVLPGSLMIEVDAAHPILRASPSVSVHKAGSGENQPREDFSESSKPFQQPCGLGFVGTQRPRDGNSETQTATSPADDGTAISAQASEDPSCGPPPD
jgi:hypothetical protein